MMTERQNRWINLAVVALLLLLVPRCGSSGATPWKVDGGVHPDGGAVWDGGSAHDGGPGADGGPTVDGGPAADGGSVMDGGSSCQAAQFDPNDRGNFINFMIMTSKMMGQDIALGAGAAMPGAREDFNGAAPSSIPLDTCVITQGDPPPECTTAQDCASEQDCVLDKDNSGNPIANTGKCTTQRDPIDVGSFTVTGFNGGPKTFAYTENGSGDGQLQPSAIAFNKNYSFSGAGSSQHGLGAYTGTLFVPSFVSLTSPAVTLHPTLQIPMIEVDATQDLNLSWSGSDGTSVLQLSLASSSATLECRVRDDGSFTITAAQLGQVGLSIITFINILTLLKETQGELCGTGLKRTDISYQQMFTVNIKKL